VPVEHVEFLFPDTTKKMIVFSKLYKLGYYVNYDMTAKSSGYSPFFNYNRHHTVNACVTPIVSCHGTHITTIESLSSKENNTCHIFQVRCTIRSTPCAVVTPGFYVHVISIESHCSYVRKPLQKEIPNVATVSQASL